MWAAIAATVLLMPGCGQSKARESADAASSPSATTSSDDPETATSDTASYDWVDGITPADTYSLTFVRAMSPSEALGALGDVRRDAGSLTSEQALSLESDLADPDNCAAPPVVQIGSLHG